jgi:hypothetical protein
MALTYSRVKKAKNKIVEALFLMPNHHHRDPATIKECKNCTIKALLKDAYTSLPSDQELNG